jgi:hypothetical protein
MKIDWSHFGEDTLLGIYGEGGGPGENPLRTWEFINKVTSERLADKPLPRTIREYLHRVSEKILQIEGGANVDRQIKNATELTGNHFRRHRGEEKAYQIFEKVEEYLCYGVDKTVAIQKVSEEFFLDEKTVKKYYYNIFKDWYGDEDEDDYEE